MFCFAALILSYFTTFMPHQFAEASLTAQPMEIAGESAFDTQIRFAAMGYHIDPSLIKAVITVESDFDFLCVSSKGARGLMQLVPKTAKLLHVQNVFNPQENILGGTRHLSYLLRTYHNNLPLALAAYNAGEGPVLLHHAIPPYEETQKYVQKVLAAYARYRSESIS